MEPPVMADPNTRSSTHITESLSRTQQRQRQRQQQQHHQAHSQPKSCLPLYKATLDLTDRLHMPLIWPHDDKCVHTFALYILTLYASSRLLYLSSDGVLGHFSLTPAHFAYTSCILPVFFSTRYHTTHMLIAFLYIRSFPCMSHKA
jgi:hypothetical protein